MMDRNQMLAPKAINRRTAEGAISPSRLEDSYPFLDPKEVEDNLNIIHTL